MSVGITANSTSEVPNTPRCRPGILVADDDPAVRVTLQLALEMYGCSVWAAADGKEAVELYTQHGHEISLVLLDVRMPRLDGPETLAQLRLHNPSVRCCFITEGEGDPRADEALLRLGVGHLLRKPFGFDAVGRRMRQLVQTLDQIEHWQK